MTDEEIRRALQAEADRLELEDREREREQKDALQAIKDRARER